MSTMQSKRIVQQYLDDLHGKPKTRALMDKYISDKDEELKQHIELFEASFPGYSLETKEMVAEDDKVFLSFVFKGTHKKDFMGVPASNKTVSVPGSIVYHLEDGMIVGHDMVVDTLMLMQQIGAVPEMAG